MVEHRGWHRKLCFYYNAFWAGCQSTLRAVTCVEYTLLIQYAISLPGAPRAAHMHRLQGCFWLPAEPGLAARMDSTKRNPDNLLAEIAFLTFVALGLNAG
jgi:hypothetical protein